MCTHTYCPLSSHLPTLVPRRLVLSPEATCSTLFEELRLEAPQATRDFWGRVSFGPRAMAVQEKEERRSLHLGQPNMPPAPAAYRSGPPLHPSRNPPLPLWGLKALPAPQERVTRRPPSGPEVGQEDGLCLECPRLMIRTINESWTSPYFAIIIKLLADQSLVGTAGVLEEGKEKADPLSAHSQPTQVLSLAPASASPPPSSICQLEGSHPGMRKTRAGLPSTPSPAV